MPDSILNVSLILPVWPGRDSYKYLNDISIKFSPSPLPSTGSPDNLTKVVAPHGSVSPHVSHLISRDAGRSTWALPLFIRPSSSRNCPFVPPGLHPRSATANQDRWKVALVKALPLKPERVGDDDLEPCSPADSEAGDLGWGPRPFMSNNHWSS